MKLLLVFSFFLLYAVNPVLSQEKVSKKITAMYKNGKLLEGYIDAEINDFDKILVYPSQNSNPVFIIPNDLKVIKDEMGNELIKTYKFENKEYFIKMLVGGEANLYYFRDKNTEEQFLAETDAHGTKELIQTSKERRIDNKSYNAKTKQYIGTLKLLLNDCPDSSIEQTAYSIRDISNVFMKYNTCRSNLTYTSGILERKPEFRIALLGGVNLTTMDTYLTTLVEDFEPKTSINFGAEFSYIPTVVTSRFSTTFGIFYSEKSGSANSLRRNFETLEITYKIIDLNFGVRYNLLPIDSRFNPYVGVNLNKGFIINDLNKDFVQIKEGGDRVPFYSTTPVGFGNSFNLALTYETGINYFFNDKSGLTAKALYFRSVERSHYFEASGFTFHTGYFFRF